VRVQRQSRRVSQARRRPALLLWSITSALLMLVLMASAPAATAGVVAWGGNSAGDLGDGANTGPEECSSGYFDPCSLVPVAVGGLSDVKSVAAGGAHGLALLDDGTVMAWGSNGSGQLGAGSPDSQYPNVVTGPETCDDPETSVFFACSTTPVPVNGLSEVTAVAAGNDFSLALLENGTVVAWGANDAGVLGTFPGRLSTVPVLVDGLSEVTAIAAGSDFALALLKNGTVMAWGAGGSGQLGDANNEYSEVPVPVSGLGEVTAITAGEYSSFALLKNGTIMAWGANSGGQLGDGTTTESDIPVPVSDIDEAAAVASGKLSSYALLKNGTVVAWGTNTGPSEPEGELGDGSETNSDTPVPVCAVGETAPCSQQLGDVTAIAAGPRDALALLANGTAVAWGSSDLGQLGDGYLDLGPDRAVGGSDAPVPVDGLDNASAISAGHGFNLTIGSLTPLPTITSLNPSSGPGGGDTPVRITGSNLASVITVKFGSTPASFTVDSQTEITAISPPSTGMSFVDMPGATITPPGTVFVTAQSPAGASPASLGLDLFAYGPETETTTANASQTAASNTPPAPAVNTLGHPAAHTTPKPLTNQQKLTKALKQCEKDKTKAKRTACEKQARRRYATAAKKANSKKRRH